MFLATCESSITKKTKEETDFGEGGRKKRKKGKKGFVEAKVRRLNGGSTTATLNFSHPPKIFHRLERERWITALLNLRNHLWLLYIYIYDVSLSRLMDLAGLDFPIRKKERRAPSDTNCRGI